MPNDTIYAVSSGRPPAAIAIMRISGPDAGRTLIELCGTIPPERVATLRTIRDRSGEVLDRAIVLWFPGPGSATGEDVAELHLHGGAAVVRAVERAIAAIGLRAAEPGEFTRRAVFNGRLDLNEAEGLADLLAAETETQRREAMMRASGAIGRELDGWTVRLLDMAAEIERAIDYDDGEVETVVDIAAPLAALRADILRALRRPSAERLRDGTRVAIVGPVNAGKSSLFNALVGSEAAIVTAIPGTTRDVVERSIVIDDIPFVLIDTAGQRSTDDPIERIGIDRARQVADTADIIIDFSDNAIDAARRIAVRGKADVDGASHTFGRLALSVATGEGIDTLVATLRSRAADFIPGPSETTLNARMRDGLAEVTTALDAAATAADPIIVAACLANARRHLDRIAGRADIDDLLDTLFSRFCLGK